MAFEFKKIESQIIEGVWKVKPSIGKDNRGNIWTSYLEQEIKQLLNRDVNFIHDKFSMSKQNVLRGIHGDLKTWKLVTCVYGEIYQVVVDCREKSHSFGKYDSFQINYQSPISILIPPGLGNGYFVKSDLAVYHYKLAYDGEYFDAKDQFSFKWNDPMFNITWPSNNPILSDRDK